MRTNGKCNHSYAQWHQLKCYSAFRQNPVFPKGPEYKKITHKAKKNIELFLRPFLLKNRCARVCFYFYLAKTDARTFFWKLVVIFFKSCAFMFISFDIFQVRR